MEQPGESRLETFLLDSAERGRRGWHWLPRALLFAVAALVLLGWYWSREPDGIDPAAQVAIAQSLQSPAPPVAAVGMASTVTLVGIARTLLDKPGGYTANDALLPGVLLDNMPSFEAGMLAHMRDMVRAMRRDFSLSAAQSVEDPDLVRAESRFRFDSQSWLIPSTEGEYRDGIAALESYASRLAATPAGGAHFFARKDNLARWLEDVDERLRAYGQQLSAAAASGDSQTPWLAVDNGFYEARGYCWALRAQLAAVQIDFAPVLADHHAGDVLAQAVLALDGTQQPVRSPVILNGSEYGLLANHSLVMAGYIARTRAGVMQVRQQLAAE